MLKNFLKIAENAVVMTAPVWAVVMILAGVIILFTLPREFIWVALSALCMGMSFAGIWQLNRVK